MFENRYREMFSQITAPANTVQEVLNMKLKKRGKTRVMTLIAAALLICALATTAFAYTSLVVYENPGRCFTPSSVPAVSRNMKARSTWMM